MQEILPAYLLSLYMYLLKRDLSCEDADKGDFVFIDSPYAPLNPTSFEAYTKEGFDVESNIFS